MNDPVEEFLVNTEEICNAAGALNPNASYFQDMKKLLRLVRVYREANGFFAEDFTWSRVMADAKYVDYSDSSRLLTNMYGAKARVAEAKAREIVGQCSGSEVSGRGFP